MPMLFLANMGLQAILVVVAHSASRCRILKSRRRERLPRASTVSIGAMAMLKRT